MFDSPVVSIHIPQALRGFAGGHHEITASGDTVGDVIDALGHEYPAIRSYLISTSGQLQPGVAVFLGPRAFANYRVWQHRSIRKRSSASCRLERSENFSFG
jgi:molybdopterin converting factor small subunit